MPVYVTLCTFTDQSVKDVKAVVAEMEAAKIVQSMGGSILTGYWLMGPYDAVVISEFADDETASAACLVTSAKLGLRTTTMRALNNDQFHRILDKMP